MEQLTSFKGNKKLKSMLLTELGKHRKADQIIKGTYERYEGKEFKGCAVGCSVYSLNQKLGKNYSTSDHSAYETELGIPEWLARLEDTIFEGLPTKESQLWPERFTKAIPIGVDLNPIKYKFCAFILKENIDRVLTLKIEDSLKEQVVKSIQGVLVLHENAIKTGKWDESAESAAWSAAESARSAAESAWSAAESAWSAAWSARSAESAAWSARSARSAQSAAQSAQSAAWSAAWSAARSAWSAARSAWSAESAAYVKYADELIRLIKDTK